MKKPVLLLFFIVAGVAAWYTFGEKYYREYFQPLKDTSVLTLYGNVEIRRVNLGFRTSGRIEAIHFEEGDFIPKGKIIATLDRKPFEANLAAAEARLESAKAVLERLENGSRRQEIEEARAQLEEYRASLTVAKADYERDSTLVEQKVISDSEFDTSLSKRDVAAARVRRAEETLSLLEEGPRKEDIAAAKAQQAEAEANRTQMEITLADTELICPNDGILLTRIEEPGAVVQAGQTVITLSLKDVVWIYVYIDEPDLGKIGPGRKVEIRTDSSDKIYTGRIGYISPEAEFTPKNVETPTLRTNLVYRVRITAESPDDGLRQGMPVTVRIPLEESKPGMPASAVDKSTVDTSSVGEKVETPKENIQKEKLVTPNEGSGHDTP